jgi:hypothetical protein
MKKIIIKLTSSLIVAASILAIGNTASASVSVNGYFKSNGTYVAPHFRTAPDNSLFNNYSYWK